MKIRLLLPVLAALLAADPAAAAIRTVFVGIDTYRHSVGKPGNADPGFRDLGGAVNDLVLIRDVLAARPWGLKLPAFDRAAACEAGSVGAGSITLTNECATRAAMIAALTGQIAAAAPGDTILFYYSGHGSTAYDRRRSQAAGSHGTLVPHDSRGGDVHDILDVDLGRLIDAAQSRGVSFVTIADSCNSGSITRDLRGGAARFASPDRAPAGPAADIVPPPPLANSANPYRIQLSAAADNQIAKELPIDGTRHGVFTVALAAALRELPRPSYADLANAVATRVAIGSDSQTPVAEGGAALAKAFLGRDQPVVRAFEARAIAADRIAIIGGGSLGGVTPGSSYAVFAGRGEPAPGARPLALGVVDVARPTDAELKLTGGFNAPAGPMTAIEREHVYAGPPLRVRIDGGTPDQRSALAAAMTSVSGIEIAADSPSYVLAIAGDSVQLLAAADGHAIGSAFPASGAAMATAASDRARKIANFAAVLALRNDNGARWGSIDIASYACTDPALRPPLERPGALPAAAYVGDTVNIRYKNLTDRPLHAYLVAFGTELEVVLLTPGQDRLEGGSSLVYHSPLNGAGLVQVMLLLADNPVNLGALTQTAVRDIAPPQGNLERLLLAARNGQLSRDIVRVNEWGGLAASLLIRPAAERRGPPPCEMLP
jgi:hypothetical protein